MLLIHVLKIEFFVNDYGNALNTANAVDAKIQSDGSVISSNYAELVALSLRQALGSMDITITRGSNKNWNTTNLKIFMKNTGSVGGGGYAQPFHASWTNLIIIYSRGLSVNSVDVLYAALPVFLYINATWGQALLTPLLEYQDSNLYNNSFASQDLGENSIPLTLSKFLIGP